MMDVKTLSGAVELYREGPHARSTRRGAPVAERARRVHGDYVRRARELDHKHSRQADGSPYPGVREQGRRHLVGPVLAALRAWDPVVGLVVGSYQGCSEELHALAREVAEEALVLAGLAQPNNKKRERKFLMIYPNDRFKVAWDIMISVTLLMSCFLTLPMIPWGS